jgi:hypothetical protein
LWGHENGTKNRFKFQLASLYHFYFVKIFFTLFSITGKTTNRYTPRLIRFRSELDGQPIDCAIMDEVTAEYQSEFLCEYYPNPYSRMDWIG